MKEIERKFLVNRDRLPDLGQAGQSIIQSYLSLEPEVRVRIVDDAKAYLTVKGAGTFVRAEFEYEIPIDDARQLVRLSPHRAVEKRRYRIVAGGRTWEIDEYEGQHAGLWTAEVELTSKDEPLGCLPRWASLDVTEDERYKNRNLATSRPPMPRST